MPTSVALDNVILRLPHSPIFTESAKIKKFLFMINYCVSLVAGLREYWHKFFMFSIVREFQDTFLKLLKRQFGMWCGVTVFYTFLLFVVANFYHLVKFSKRLVSEIHSYSYSEVKRGWVWLSKVFQPRAATSL